MANLAQQCTKEDENKDQQTKWLGIFLYCYGDDDVFTWSCEATAKYSLIPQQEEVRPCFRPFSKQTFCDSSKSRDYTHFMKWDKILDPANGCIKDDSIILEVHFSVLT